MNTKHTLGPWALDLSGKGPVVGYDCEDGGPLLPIAPIVSGKDDGMIEANAKLIAAAPELLEALVLAEKIIQKLAGWSGNDLEELDTEFGYFKIPETIAKATK
jgi:hypothetical protein